MLKISITSRIADFFGRILIGSPRTILSSKLERDEYAKRGLQPPDCPNFYLKEGDRFMPSPTAHTWKVKRRMIYENQMRMKVSFYTGIYLIAFATLSTFLAATLIMDDSAAAKWMSSLGLLALVGAIVYAFIKGHGRFSLSSLMPLERMRREAMAETNAVSRRPDVPHGKETTPDLDDIEGRFELTPEGYRVTGRMFVEDMLHGSYSPAAPLWLGLFPVVAVIAYFSAQLSVLLAGAVLLFYLMVSISLVGFGFFLGVAVATAGLWFTFNFAIGRLVSLALKASSNNGDLAASLMATKGVIAAGLGFLVISLAPLIFVGMRAYGRARGLRAQGQKANAASQGLLASAHIASRKKQAQTALKDKTPWVWLGEAMGKATAKRDGFAPDAGKGFGQTLKDMGLHGIVCGASGTGKTSSILVRWLRGVLTAENFRLGALILDNKGSLPYDLLGIRSDYKVLSPDDSDVGLLEGLDGEARAASFLAVVAEKATGDNAYFINNGSTYTRHAFVFHEGLVQWERATIQAQREAYEQYTAEEIESMDEADRPMPPDEPTWLDNLATVSNVIDLMVQPPGENESVGYLAELAGQMTEEWPPAQEGGLLRDACSYIATKLPGMDEKTRSNIYSQVESWFAPLKSSSRLYRWINCEHGEPVGDVCKGAAYGLNTPFHAYKQAGLIAANMVKERVYSIVRNRPDMMHWKPEDGWTQLVLGIDECQESISKSEDTMFAVARSKGLIGLFATQSIDALVEKMGEKSAYAFLGNIATFGTFKATEATYKYMQSRLGMTENVVYAAPTMGIDYNYSANLALTSPDYDPTHPFARLMRGFVRSNGFKFKSLFKVGIFGEGVADQHSIVSLVERKREPLFDLAELSTYLEEPFVAVFQVNRGGVRRRDVIRCRLMNIQTGEDIDPYALEAVKEKLEDEVLTTGAPKPETADAAAAVAVSED